MQVQVARIGKPHGIRGEVTVQLFTDEPEERFAAGAELGVEPATPLAPRGALTVAGSRWNKSILVVRFAELTSRNDAEALRDHRLSVDSEDAEAEEGFYEHELVGLAVYAVEDPDQAELGEPVGRVTALQTGAAQDLLHLELADGAPALVPFVEEIVPEVDLEEGRVVICPPPGLLGLQEDDAAEAAEGGPTPAEDGPGAAEGGSQAAPDRGDRA